MKVKYCSVGRRCPGPLDISKHFCSNGFKQNEFCTLADKGITDTDHKNSPLEYTDTLFGSYFLISQKNEGVGEETGVLSNAGSKHILLMEIPRCEEFLKAHQDHIQNSCLYKHYILHSNMLWHPGKLLSTFHTSNLIPFANT